MVGIAHAQTQTGYRIPPRADIGGGRMTGDIWCQYGTNGVRFKIGTQAVTQVGTVGVINGTNAIGLPSLDFTYAGGSTSANFNGFNAVYIAGSEVGTSGALTGELDAVGGIGTNNTFNNPTLAGVGTITASFGANNLVISPAEYSMLDGAIIPLNTATGSITNHAHTGNDGTTQVSHTNLTDRGTQTHTQIDTFIASKASASGVASLDANSLVVQNPASGTSTPGISKISISLGTGLLDDSWLSSVISKLGQTIELGTETTGNTNNITEGSTNQYYTNARVNLVIGSSSITSPQVSPKITFTSPAAGQFLKIVDAQGNVENGTSSATVDFSAVTGSATASQIPLISGLLGSATSAQLPTILELLATTTAITGTSSNGRWYNLQANNTGETVAELFLLHFDHPGTTTSTDSSSYARTVTLAGGAIGTTSAKFGTGGLGLGASAYAEIPDSADLEPGSSSFTLEGIAYTTVVGDVGAPNYGDAIISKTVADASGYGPIVVSHTGGDIQFLASSTGSSWDVAQNVLFGSLTTNTPHHYAVCRDGNTIRLFLDGIQGGTVTTSATLVNISDSWRIGKSAWAAAEQSFIGWQDEVLYTNSAKYTSNFTPPTQAYDVSYNYNYNSVQYIPAGTTTPAFLIVDAGTESTRIDMLANVTTLGVGYGTTTLIRGTASVYKIRTVQGGGGVLTDSLNTYSTEEIKSIIDSGTRSNYLDTWKNLRIEDWYNKKQEYINNPADPVIVENQAKERYKQGKYPSWYSNNRDNYISIIDDGAGSITTSLNNNNLKEAFNGYSELLWASDLDQNKLIAKEKIEIESDTSKVNVSLIVNDPSTPAYMKTRDGLGRDLGSELGSLGRAFQELISQHEDLLAQTGSLTTRLKKAGIP